MDLSKHFILLNGESKTLQIDAIHGMAAMVIACVSKTMAAPITMVETRWFGSKIQNGKTQRSARCW